MARTYETKPVQVQAPLYNDIQDLARTSGLSATKLANLLLEKGLNEVKASGGFSYHVKQDGEKIVRTIQ